MALLSTIICEVCGLEKSVSHSASSITPDICHDCQCKEEDNKLQNHLQFLSKLSIEDRLSKIEEQLYYLSKTPEPDYYDRLIG